MAIRRGETLLVTVGIPVLLLVFFSLTHVTACLLYTSPSPRDRG